MKVNDGGTFFFVLNDQFPNKRVFFSAAQPFVFPFPELARIPRTRWKREMEGKLCKNVND